MLAIDRLDAMKVAFLFDIIIYFFGMDSLDKPRLKAVTSRVVSVD